MAFTQNGVTVTNYFAKITDYSGYPQFGGGIAMGNNSYGQLAQANQTNYSSPVFIPSYNWIDVSILRSGQGTAFVGENNKLYTAGGFGIRTTPSTIKTTQQWIQASCGYYNTMVINSNGTLWVWGANSYGQLGFGDQSNRSYPTQLGTLSNWTQVSSVNAFTAAIKNDGTLWMWGNNSYGQLGQGDTTNRSTPTQVGFGVYSNWTQVSTAFTFTLALQSNGSLWTWGQNNYGQLGNNTTTATFSSYVQMGSVSTWTQTSAGANHALAIRSNGTLWAWGNNSFGQLGLSDLTNRSSPVQIGALSNWAQVSGGEYHTVALQTNGTLWSWGLNSWGQLGVSDQTSRYSPVQVGSLSIWTKIAAGMITTVALQSNGTLWSWGNNSFGQLGLGDQSNRYSPVQVGTLSNWNNIIGGFANSLAIDKNNNLWSWGGTSYGLNATTQYINTFLPSNNSIPGVFRKLSTSQYDTYALSNIDNTLFQSTDNDIPTIDPTISWKSIATGSYHFVGVKNDGTAWSIGNNYYGQLGLNDTTYRRSITQIGAGSNWSKVVCADYGTMLIDNSLNGWVFGKNDVGQLGLSDNTHRSSPVQLTYTQIKNASMDDTGLWIVDSNSNLWASGLGNNNLFNTGFGNILSPVQSGTISTWSQVASGLNFSLAIQSNGTLWSWGNNQYGQLGNNSTTTISSPVQIGSLSSWSQIAAGQSHMLALQSNGTLWSCGYNVYGQLGQSNTTSRSSPVQVGTLSVWTKIACGYAHSVAIQSNGTLWSWGFNSNGQLGLSNQTNKLSPVQIGGLSAWSQIAAGRGQTFAINTNGTLWACGYNSLGLLGLNTSTGSYSSLVQVGGLSVWTRISTAFAHTAAIQSNGTLWAWGDNQWGELGNNSTTGSGVKSPIQVGTASNWAQISCGYGSFTAAIQSNGTLWTWGLNSYGQLGLNTIISSSSTPIQVGTLSTWNNLATTNYYTLTAIQSNGTLWAWGNNSIGQLGIFSILSSPAQKTNNNYWASVSTNKDNTLFTGTDGSLWSVGNNSFGSLGLNTTTSYSSPVQIGLINNVSSIETKNYSSIFLTR